MIPSVPRITGAFSLLKILLLASVAETTSKVSPFPILASALALKYGKGMVLLRKAGKLPGKTSKISYTIEYGKAEMEIQKTALEKNERVLICDDLLATGGTAKAAAKLVEKLNANVVGFAFIIELTELNGIEKIKEYRTEALVQY